MEIVKPNKAIPIQIGHNRMAILEAKKGYIMAQTVAMQLQQAHGADSISVTENFENIYGHKQYNREPLDGKRIAIWRTGGAGDLLFLSPSLKMLKTIYPTCHITIATSAKYAPIFDNFPYADTKIILPLPESVIQESDYYCIFEGIIEGSERASTVNAYDLFAERLGVLDKMTNEDKKPLLYVSDKNEKFANRTIEQGPRGSIGVQFMSSAPVRTYDPYDLYVVGRHFAENGYNVYIMGGIHHADYIDLVLQLPGTPKNLINLAKMNPGWLDSAAAIKKFKLMITPDSSLAHFAVAFNVPALGIYGPFNSDVRFRYYRNAVAIDQDTKCKPCYQHGQRPCRLASADKGKTISKCLKTIKPKLIIQVAEQMLTQLEK